MTPELPQSPNPAPTPEKPCPYCREAIHAEAKKCRHCGEMLEKSAPPKIETALKKGAMYIGLFTTFLGLFYTLREGYFFVVERQEQRATIESYKTAAAQFEQLDNLDYAVHTLEQALALKPNDLDLQRQYFLLRARSLLREVEDWPMTADNEEVRTNITTLTLDGFRLLQFTQSKAERAGVLITLARLLRQDINWKDETRLAALFEEAYRLAPGDAEVTFRYGQWLLSEDGQAEKGGELLRKATQLQPENALYWSVLGQYLLEKKAYQEALPALRTAIGLLPEQNESQRIRAVNSAGGALVSLVRRADAEQDITGADFLGMNMEERKLLIEETLSLAASDRELNFLAARFYHKTGDHERAVSALKASLWAEDLDYRGSYSSDIPKLELYAAILEDSGNDPETLGRLRTMLERHKEDQLYDEVKEIGYEGRRKYKVGLKVHAGASEEGVLVARAYEGYPFAKAGVQEGDRITEFAHREMKTLRDIWILLLEFAPGTELPFKVKRGEEVLDLTLVVE